MSQSNSFDDDQFVSALEELPSSNIHKLEKSQISNKKEQPEDINKTKKDFEVVFHNQSNTNDNVNQNTHNLNNQSKVNNSSNSNPLESQSNHNIISNTKDNLNQNAHNLNNQSKVDNSSNPLESQTKEEKKALHKKFLDDQMQAKLIKRNNAKLSESKSTVNNEVVNDNKLIPENRETLKEEIKTNQKVNEERKKVPFNYSNTVNIPISNQGDTNKQSSSSTKQLIEKESVNEKSKKDIEHNKESKQLTTQPPVEVKDLAKAKVNTLKEKYLMSNDDEESTIVVSFDEKSFDSNKAKEKNKIINKEILEGKPKEVVVKSQRTKDPLSTNSNYTFKNKDSFPSELEISPNLIDQTCKNSSSKLGALIVKKKQYVKELLGGYIIYSILIKDDHNSTERFLCNRRYSEFDVFHNYLSEVYPYYLIPRLTEKNLFNKITTGITNNSEFEETRIEQLTHYLNYLSSHEQLSKIRELSLFLNEQKFDLNFFKNPILHSFPICESIRNSTYSNKIFNAISYIGDIATTKIVEKRPEAKSGDEVVISKYSSFFTKQQEEMEKLQSQYNKVLESTAKRLSCHDRYKTVYFEMKDLKISKKNQEKLSEDVDFNSIESSYIDTSGEINKFQNWHRIENSLYKMISKLIEKDTTNFKNTIEYYISQLIGVNELINRYYQFVLYKYDLVKSVSSSSDLDHSQKLALKEEIQLVEGMKYEFEWKMLDELKSFVKQTNKITLEIQTNFVQYLKWESNIENSMFDELKGL